VRPVTADRLGSGLFPISVAWFEMFTSELIGLRRHIRNRQYPNPTVRTRSYPRACVMTSRRRRFKQEITLQDRIAEWAKEIRAQAAELPPGRERDELLKKVRQAETAMHLDDWANSPGLQPPTRN
jgi:hypothetical protein